MIMSRTILIESLLPCLRLLSAAAVLFAGPVGAADAPRKPNVLVLYADDLGYADLGATGGKDVPTPHLDSLARNGARFAHAALRTGSFVSRGAGGFTRPQRRVGTP